MCCKANSSLDCFLDFDSEGWELDLVRFGTGTSDWWWDRFLVGTESVGSSADCEMYCPYGTNALG